MKERKAKKVASLFVGRWQPFHRGHKKLMETVLKKGKPVVVAIRDTELSQKNPYTVEERWTKIQQELRKYGSLVKIIVVPDIDEICYGREVGYDIRKIELDEKTQAISGTKTRAKNPPTKQIIWLTGQSGSGKSTLARALAPTIGATVLDGDEMRESISKGAGFSKTAREEHNIRVARLALVLAKQTPVVVSVIAPFAQTRAKIDALVRPYWVYVHRKSQIKKSNYPYEKPAKPHLKLDMDAHTPREAAQKVAELLSRGTAKKR